VTELGILPASAGTDMMKTTIPTQIPRVQQQQCTAMVSIQIGISSHVSAGQTDHS
jgi:hypothetical protein